MGATVDSGDILMTAYGDVATLAAALVDQAICGNNSVQIGMFSIIIFLIQLSAVLWLLFYCFY